MNSLDNVKVGDKLLVLFPHDVKGIETVDRITTTLVITKHHRFIKKSGKAQGSDSWSYTYAKLATPEDAEKISREVKRKNLIRKCENINFNTLSDFQLEKILEIANNHVKLD
jgi:hypothetical protein